jgi:thymidylate synthase (FAD)
VAEYEVVSVLDKGFVRLDDYMADDLSVVNSARVSFNRRVEEMGPIDERILESLMANRHGTPFEHNSFRFHVKAPLFVFREWQRHRISSFNEWSGRYSELLGEFYIPEVEDVRQQVGKPMEYTFEPAKEEDAEIFRDMLVAHSQRAFDQYRVAIAMGIAKEQARFFLPVNIYSEMYWTVNARSMMNFLSLRNAPNAQYEITEYAIVIEDLFRQVMPITANAFTMNGRVAP